MSVYVNVLSLSADLAASSHAAETSGAGREELALGLSEFRTLADIGEALVSSTNLETALQRALVLLEQSGALHRCVLALQCADEVRIFQPGFPSSSIESYGRVVDTPAYEKLCAVLAPDAPAPGDISTDADNATAILCVPISVNENIVGAFAAFAPAPAAQAACYEFMRVIASMVAQASQHHKLLDDATQRMLDDNVNLRRELSSRYDFSSLVSDSGPMRQIFEQVAQVACTNTTVLVRGDTGTGKELIAKAIHGNSPRARMPLIKVNCAAIPDELLESELFGSEKGAFTGAHTGRKGKFEMAEGGTILLDEVGDLSLTAQVKLLRVLQEREVVRLGSETPIQLNVRVIATSNRDLETAIATGKFRADLYYRLNVFPILVPPLRQRREDVLVLAHYFLEKFSVEHGKEISRISPRVIDLFKAHDWPGNVRELETTMERAVVTCNRGVIHRHHLPPMLQGVVSANTAMSSSLTEAVEEFERELILDVLRNTRGNRSHAARLLSTSERVISYKVRKYAIDCEQFREE